MICLNWLFRNEKSFAKTKVKKERKRAARPFFLAIFLGKEVKIDERNDF